MVIEIKIWCNLTAGSRVILSLSLSWAAAEGNPWGLLEIWIKGQSKLPENLQCSEIIHISAKISLIWKVMLLPNSFHRVHIIYKKPWVLLGQLQHNRIVFRTLRPIKGETQCSGHICAIVNFGFCSGRWAGWITIGSVPWEGKCNSFFRLFCLSQSLVLGLWTTNNPSVEFFWLCWTQCRAMPDCDHSLRKISLSSECPLQI